jgi:phospholipid/cholesterol/gamma-HCH transport system substrate-binding protein
MKDKTNHITNTCVGAIVVLITGTVLVLIIWLSFSKPTTPYSTYAVYVTESVSGLEEDSQVKYNGVDVGTVKKIEIDKKNPRLVKITLSLESSTPITQSTVATLATNSFVTGISYLSLSDVGENMHKVAKVSGEKYPVITSAPSITTRLDTTLTQLQDNFYKITSVVRSSFTPDDLEMIKETGYSLNVAMSLIKGNSQHITLTYNNIKLVGSDFVPVKLYKKAIINTLTIQLLPVMYELVANTESTYNTLEEVKKFIKEHPTVLIFGTKPAPLDKKVSLRRARVKNLK